MRFHTNLPVIDIDNTIAFYRILFGESPVKVKSDYAKFLPSSVDINISFHKNPTGVEKLSTLLHLGLEVSDLQVLEQIYDRLQKAALVTVDRETSVCCYAQQDKFWVRDPSGYRWEVYALLKDTALKHDAVNRCCSSS